MNKIIRNFAIIFVLLVGLVILAGCGKSNSLVGSWEYSGYTYNFNDDKTGSYNYNGNKMTFTYEDDGKKVSILYKDNTTPSTYEYKIDGKTLIIKDSFGNDVKYVKK